MERSMDPNQISRFIVMMTVTMNIQPGKYSNYHEQSFVTDN